MKPLHLRLCAFGAFADAVDVDFEALAPRGLFLVSGETGAGKTTLFDAMCWALYGEMPLKDSHGVRSDHVEPTTRCEVTFTFTCDGERYTVTRNPEQLRPSKRGGSGSAREAAAAELVRHTATGTEPVATRVAEVARACERILGLDATQFQRVILLPQGEVSRFLLATTGEREQLLETLFGGEVFDRITEELKYEAAAFTAKLAESDLRLTGKLREAGAHLAQAAVELGEEPPAEVEPEGDEAIDPQVLRQAHGTLRASAEQHQGEANRTADLYKRALEAHHEAESGAARFDRAEKLEATLQGLAATAGDVEAARVNAVASAAARPVTAAADAADEALAVQRAAVAVRDERVRLLTGLLDGLGAPLEELTPVALERNVGALRATHEEHKGKLAAREAAAKLLADRHKAQTSLASEIADLQKAQGSTAERKREIDGELPALRERALDPAGIRKAIDEAGKLAADRATLGEVEEELRAASTHAAEAAQGYARLLQSFVDTQAPRLAATLEAGEPCPVCGSTTHPRPAVGEDVEPASWAQVEAAGQQQTAATSALEALKAQLGELRGRLGEHASATVQELGEREGALKRELEEVLAAHRTLTGLNDELAKVDTALREVDLKLAGRRERKEGLDAEVREAEAAAAKTAEEARGIDPAELHRRAATLEELHNSLEGYDALVTAVEAAGGTVTARHDALHAALHKSPYPDVAGARAALLPPDQEEQALAAAAEHQRRQTEAKAALEELRAEGIPDARPDAAATKAALVEAEQVKLRVEQQLSAVKVHLANADAALLAHQELGASTADLRERAALAERAYQVCRQGGPGQQVSLKRWVLAHQLDRIAAAANVHLQQMTNGRYALHRAQEQRDGRRSFGLDLEVGDANTGRHRATSSLSGGEQFQASLALALGLADVISHGGTASGRQFEALFVDEGFGSLSSDALDDAVETLVRLQDAGRMVGAITHVESMKELLHVGIAVHKRDDGRGSTLEVNS